MKTFRKYMTEIKKPTGDLKKACWTGYTAVGMKMKNGRKVPNCVPEETDSEFAKRMKKQAEQPPTKGMSQKDKVDKGWAHPNTLKKPVKEEVELDEVAAWQRKEGKNPSGGLNQKGVDSYRREHPGSKLKTAVTTKPSKLKAGSAAANRRKSFCARMSGMKKRLTSAKTARDPDSRINKSLRKWNC
jgi:hypothetical protein